MGLERLARSASSGVLACLLLAFLQFPQIALLELSNPFTFRLGVELPQPCHHIALSLARPRQLRALAPFLHRPLRCLRLLLQQPGSTPHSMR